MSAASVQGGSTPKQARAIQTKATLLDAAAALFARKGFRSVTMQEIADRAGMTKGAVYFHFPNKEAIAIHLVESFYAGIPEMSVETGGRSPLDLVRSLTAATARRMSDDVTAQAAVRMQTERSLVDVDFPMPFVDHIALYTALLTEAREQGELPADVDPASLTRLIVASFFGVHYVSWILTNREDIVERVDEMLDRLLPPA